MSDKKKLEFSKKLIKDIRALLWIVTLGGIGLAVLCIFQKYTAGLPFITAMIGLPWTAHGTVCAFYMNKSKAENTIEGIKFETAKANNFQEQDC